MNSIVQNAMRNILEEENKTYVSRARPNVAIVPINMDDLISNMEIPYGQTLKIIRESRRLTIADVTDYLNISPKSIWRMEAITEKTTNIPGLRITNLYRALSDLYGVTKEQMCVAARKNPFVGIMMWDSFWDEEDNMLPSGKVMFILRDKKGVSRREMAERTGLLVDNISRIENKSRFSVQNIQKMLEILKVEPIEFYDMLLSESEKHKKNIKDLIIGQ